METTARMPRAQLEWLRARTRRDDDVVLPLVRRKPPLELEDAVLDAGTPAAPSRGRVWLARVLAVVLFAAALTLLWFEYGAPSPR